MIDSTVNLDTASLEGWLGLAVGHRKALQIKFVTILVPDSWFLIPRCFSDAPYGRIAYIQMH